MMSELNISAILGEAYERVKKRMGFYIALVIVYILLLTALSLIGKKFGNIGNIIIRLFEIYINAGVLKIVITEVNDKEPELFDLFTAEDVYLNFLIGSILYGLAVGFGVLLLIIPGIIFAVMWQFYKFAIVEKKMGPVDALRYSGEITKGYRWKIFGFDILLGLINVAGALALLVGLLFTIPLTMIAEGVLYRWLKDNYEGMVEEPDVYRV